ncbi:MAG: asparaginase domain-containing protein [Epsilonproteobacteria bacterium]|nr:asparaginase domain-containing protein [Campylobacterota bacterium]
MKKILLINSGGTYNKIYNPLTGNLDIDTKGTALKSMAQHWLTSFELINIIGKDSLDMNDNDREEILKVIKNSTYEQIIIVHGTDTIDRTANYLAHAKLNKTLVLTGAMVPFSIDPIEATANLASAYGFLLGLNNHGVFIAMNGKIELYQNIKKNREMGHFELNEL